MRSLLFQLFVGHGSAVDFKERIHKSCGIEFLQIVDALTDTDIFHRNMKFGLNRYGLIFV